MTPLRDAYPPLGKPVRLWRDGQPVGGQWVLEVRGRTTKHYMWRFLWQSKEPDETRDAWEAV